MNWHVALVGSGTEQRAMNRLRAANFDVLWPRWVEKVARFGRPIEVTRALASGYVLVSFDGTDAENWHRVRELSGGVGFIGGEWPTAVPQRAMDELLARCFTDDGLMDPPDASGGQGMLSVGDRVHCNFTDDSVFYPWVGQEAVVRWDDNRGVALTMVMMGRETGLYVPYPEALALDLVEKKRRLYRSPQSARGMRHFVTRQVAHLRDMNSSSVG